MKAAFITRFGPPEVIQYGDQPTPAPQPNEVRVKVAAVAVNPIDTYVRSGMLSIPRESPAVIDGDPAPADYVGQSSLIPLEFPYILGCDLAGTVESCGTSVSRFKPGDRVWGSNQGLFGRRGTFAEYAVVDEQWLYGTPDALTDVEAAAGALVGITAHLGLFLHAGVEAGETVFVNGGTGGVGSSVVQLARAAGARVIATVGSDEKKCRCEELGGDCVLDYHSESLDDAIRRFAEPTGGVNVWIETLRQPTFDRTAGLMAKRGRIILMAGRESRPVFPVGPFYLKDLRMLGLAMFNASADEQRECAAALNKLASVGKWKPHIGRTFPLSAAAAAHQLQEDNTLGKQGTLEGKIVLTP